MNIFYHCQKKILSIFLVFFVSACKLQNQSFDNSLVTTVGENNSTKNTDNEKSNRGVSLNTADFLKQYAGQTILGNPTNKSVMFNVIASENMEVFIEYGKSPNNYSQKTAVIKSVNGKTIELEILGLEANTKYYYRTFYRNIGENNFRTGTTNSFYTQRSPGTSFSFGIQGDSHPERINKMFHPDLYTKTMENVSSAQNDFYLTIGDDFSIENLLASGNINQEAVDAVYLNQRKFIGTLGIPLYLVNGNHEQAAKYLLDGTDKNGAILAAKARTNIFSLPSPDNFYGGNSEKLDFVGQLKNYYSWTWGDALFVVIDFYWHSKVPVDNIANTDSSTTSVNDKTSKDGGKKNATPKRSDLWDITLGETQYKWFKKTLEDSNSKYKFVFAHHVLGTGRGGIEIADKYEWGGKGKDGTWEFAKNRQGWELPIHQLMVKNNVSIFFQGHDHLFAKQELDGIVYQSLPNPADNTYTAFNRDAYKTGEILPNSGFVKVNVSNEKLTVDYIRSFLPGDEEYDKNGEVAFSYSVLPKE